MFNNLVSNFNINEWAYNLVVFFSFKEKFIKLSQLYFAKHYYYYLGNNSSLSLIINRLKSLCDYCHKFNLLNIKHFYHICLLPNH